MLLKCFKENLIESEILCKALAVTSYCVTLQDGSSDQFPWNWVHTLLTSLAENGVPWSSTFGKHGLNERVS